MDKSVALVTTGFYMNPGSIIAIGVIFPVLGIIAVMGRFGVRKSYGMSFLMDDWICIPALVCVIAQGVVYIYGAKRALLGYRLSPDATPAEVKAAVSSHDPSTLRMIELACNIISALSTGLIRLSFLLFYRRIFRGRSFNIASWTLVTVTVAWSIAMIITYFTICPYYLNPRITVKLSCGRMLYFLGAYSITGFVLDLFILCLPFPWLTQIWRLKRPNSQKWAVTSVFLCGGFTVAASCVRMVCGIQVLLDKPGQYSTIIGLKSYGDIIGGAGVWLFWSFIENGTGMIVVCLPSLAPLIPRTSTHAPRRSLDHGASVKGFVIPSSGTRSNDNTTTNLADGTSQQTRDLADSVSIEKPMNTIMAATMVDERRSQS